MKGEELKRVVEAIAETYDGEFVVIAVEGEGRGAAVHYGGRGAVLRAISTMRPVLETTFAAVTEAVAEECGCPKCVAFREGLN